MTVTRGGILKAGTNTIPDPVIQVQERSFRLSGIGFLSIHSILPMLRVSVRRETRGPELPADMKG
jgi:hypothetical protein